MKPAHQVIAELIDVAGGRALTKKEQETMRKALEKLSTTYLDQWRAAKEA